MTHSNNQPLIYPNTKALIFDLDGTLADTMPLHFKAWSKAAEINNFQLTEKLFLECAGLPTQKIVGIINQKHNLNLNPQKFSDLKETFFRHEMEQIKAIDPIANIVYKYYGKLPMAVGTGGRKSIALQTLKLLELDTYLPIVVTGDDVNAHKPAPDTFLRCAQLMNIDPSQCQVFEDAERGIQAAKNAGMMVTDVREYL